MADQFPMLAVANASIQINDTDKSAMLSPFEIEEHIVWAFNLGIRGRLDEKNIAKLTEALSSTQAKTSFLKGYVDGLYEGGKLAVKENIEATIEILKLVIKGTKKFYETVYDPTILGNMVTVYSTAPNTDARNKALNDFANHISKTHPEISKALSYLTLVEPVINELMEWLKQPDAINKLIISGVKEIGTVIGDQLEILLSVLDKPKELGFKVGEILGQAFMQIVIYLIGL